LSAVFRSQAEVFGHSPANITQNRREYQPFKVSSRSKNIPLKTPSIEALKYFRGKNEYLTFGKIRNSDNEMSIAVIINNVSIFIQYHRKSHPGSPLLITYFSPLDIGK
jgi:hypothetical protein